MPPQIWDEYRQCYRNDPWKVINVPIFSSVMGHLSPFLQEVGRTLLQYSVVIWWSGDKGEERHMREMHSDQKMGKIFTGQMCKLLLSLTIFYGHFRYLQVLHSKWNYNHYLLSYSMDFKAPQELWNPLSKAVPGEFHGSGRHDQCDCLLDQANFHRSQAWEVVLIFTTRCIMMKMWIYNENPSWVHWHWSTLYLECQLTLVKYVMVSISTEPRPPVFIIH